MNNFVANNYSTTSPGAPVCPCAFGSVKEEKKAAATLFKTSPIATKASEAMGEAGALHVLMQVLAAQKLPFEESQLFVFEGANSFNMVYLNAAPPKATAAIVIEAKGGSSTLGTRKSATSKRRVKQGTRAYAETIVHVMAKTKAKGKVHDDRRDVAKNLRRIANTRKAAAAGGPLTAASSKTLYVGVATKYDKKAKVVHNLVIIFSRKI